MRIAIIGSKEEKQNKDRGRIQLMGKGRKTKRKKGWDKSLNQKQRLTCHKQYSFPFVMADGVEERLRC